jgi:serine/threonine-protein kinase HipA
MEQGRMIFNAIVGNDDDHPRNHAVIFDIVDNRWRLAPAFDVVPNPAETPNRLVMQVSAGRREVEREAMLADHTRFGFARKCDAEIYMDNLVERIRRSFNELKHILGADLERLMSQRIQATMKRLVPTMA